jgi:hypothetical protein
VLAAVSFVHRTVLIRRTDQRVVLPDREDDSTMTLF